METVNRLSSMFELDDGCGHPSHESRDLLEGDHETQRLLSPDELQSLVKVLERVAKIVVDEQRFDELSRQWKQETKFLSNITAKSVHPAYQKIIGMGEAAVPLILTDLKENGPRDWFWALTMITNENPITEDIAGNMSAMTEAWIKWGTKVGYLKNCPQKTKVASQVS